jgi:hypothetical protein
MQLVATRRRSGNKGAVGVRIYDVSGSAVFGGLLVAIGLAGCAAREHASAPEPSASPSPAAATAPAVESGSASSAASPGPAVADLGWLARIAPPEGQASRGPIRVTGYSRVVSTGMNDPAHVVGFSRDGTEFGYCAFGGGIDPQVLTCEFIDAAGHTTRTTDYGSHADFQPRKHAEIVQWLSDAGVPELPKGKDGLPVGPELKGDWDFAGSIVLALAENVPAPSGALVRLGGSVDGEAPVFTYTISVQRDPMTFHTAWVNGLVLSPDGSEVGIVAGFFCMEWCDDFVVRRIPVRTLASRVFNDTGMRHHTKKDYAASARLFARAVQADPGNALAAYNLACALARLGDPDAERALGVAVRLGGDEVRARAAKDDDLRGVHVDALGTGAGAGAK